MKKALALTLFAALCVAGAAKIRQTVTNARAYTTVYDSIAAEDMLRLYPRNAALADEPGSVVTKAGDISGDAASL